MKTNADKLVMLSVTGQVSSPMMAAGGYRIAGNTGAPVILPGVGGITYNVRVGDSACGWVADHVEPGVSVKNLSASEGNRSANNALNILAAIGNDALVISGDAKGAKGTVTGKHGGIEHVLVDFDAQTLNKMAIGDNILVRAVGTGLKIDGFDHIKIMNLDPRLLSKMNVQAAGGKVEVPVTCIIPAKLMGSGIGKPHAHSGDYDIQLLDRKTIDRLGIPDIRLGDILAIKDADHTFGRMYRKGSMTIGVVVHSDCVISGHGPGVTTIMTSSGGRIVPRIDAGANIARILKIGSFRGQKPKGGKR